MRVKKEPSPELVAVPMLVAKWASEHIRTWNPGRHPELVFGLAPPFEQMVRIARPLSGKVAGLAGTKISISDGVTVRWIDLPPTQAACAPALEEAVETLIDCSQQADGHQRQIELNDYEVWKAAIMKATRAVGTRTFTLKPDWTIVMANQTKLQMQARSAVDGQEYTWLADNRYESLKNWPGPAGSVLDLKVVASKRRQCNFELSELNRLGFRYAAEQLTRAKFEFQPPLQFAAGYDFAMLANAKPEITTAEIDAADAAFEGM